MIILNFKLIEEIHFKFSEKSNIIYFNLLESSFFRGNNKDGFLKDFKNLKF